MTEAAERWIAAIKARAQPCAALVHGSAWPSRRGCRLGGLPSIGGRHSWPTVDGRPLSFVAEIDLAQVGSAFTSDWLPEGGWLHFFYDLVEQPWGFRPSDRGRFAVLYTPDAEPAAEAPPPPGLDKTLLLPSLPVRPEAACSLPHPHLLENELGIMADLGDDGWERVNDFIEEAAPCPRHQVGGHPSPLQGPNLALDCQLASSGIDIGEPDGYRRPDARLLAGGAADWRLLLQLDSDEDAMMMWGDMGMLYFMVRREDAIARDFSGAWVVLQCS